MCGQHDEKKALYRVIRPLKSENVSARQTRTNELKMRKVLPFFAIAEPLLSTEESGRASIELEDELVEAETKPSDRGWLECPWIELR